MTRYILSPAARRDIAEIWLYTADKWGVDQADAYIAQIQEDLRKAAAGLRIAQRIDRFWKMRSGHHLCIFDKEAEDRIWIVRILHEWMDLAQNLAD